MNKHIDQERYNMRLKKIVLSLLLCMSAQNFAMDNEGSQRDDSSLLLRKQSGSFASFLTGVTSTESIELDSSPISPSIKRSGDFAHVPQYESEKKGLCRCFLDEIWADVVRLVYNKKHPGSDLEHKPLPGCYNEITIDSLIVFASSLNHKDSNGLLILPEKNKHGKLIARFSKNDEYNRKKNFLAQSGYSNQDKVTYPRLYYGYEAWKKMQSLEYCQPCLVTTKK